MPNSTSVTSDDLGIQSINLGNDLVPFTALTTLIGSDIAEKLALGERGPAGLVWSIASVFGAPSVIKAFISGASPGWLRSLLGLRSIASDRAVGLDLKLARKSRQAIKVRRTFDHQPLGVSCDANALRRAQSEPLSRDHPSCKDVYAFDRSTMRVVEGLKKTLPRDPLTVYVGIQNPLLRVRTTIIQSPALALSLLKCLELYWYWTNGAHYLAVILAIPFAFFFVFGCIITFRGKFLAWRLGDIGNLDVIIGDLPTWKKAGGEKKVVLGLLAEPRTSIWWRLMWSIGGLLHIFSLAFTYFVLSKMTVVFMLMWAGFQVAWHACRILTYHFTESMREPMADLMMVGHRWQDLDVMMKTRVLNLTLAAAQYQIHVHPNGIESHTDDSFSPLHIMNLLSEPQKLQMSCELPRHFNPSKSSSIEIEITAVIGDSVLSSAMWMVGSDVSPMDMYDSCLVFLSFPSPLSPSSPSSLGPRLAPSTFAIPAARVGCSMGDVNRPDKEESTPVFAPRGTCARRSEYTHTRCYWIPCGPNRWLQIQSKNLMAVSGRCTAEVLDDGQLSALLGAGTLNISLTHVKDVKEVVEFSRVGVEALFSLLPGSK
ncbi:hypothetical protein B0F90DRAFT_1821759 [Multifurca ochricompacta]|uniref:Uncharacterized protein n=1 Tax=Multifurca ochricompacta TaxID=376703 RepID=A0AAD4LXU0_9AGAM|nr:hypothetical protein B0F90DRAFT_1821759 [Multifurca ochricompacta]